MEYLQIAAGSKADKYDLLLRQAEALFQDEPDMIARMANLSAMLHDTFCFWWTGFYRVQGNELVLGPFQGPLACTRIKYGRGVCGTAWKEGATQLVPNVELFPGHIACSSASRSEIVVPIHKDDQVIAVLDIDSEHLATFDAIDQHYLERLAAMLV